MIKDDLLSRIQEGRQREKRLDPDQSRTPTRAGPRPELEPEPERFLLGRAARLWLLAIVQPAKGPPMLLLLATLAAAFAILLVVALN